MSEVTPYEIVPWNETQLHFGTKGYTLTGPYKGAILNDYSYSKYYERHFVTSKIGEVHQNHFDKQIVEKEVINISIIVIGSIVILWLVSKCILEGLRLR